MEGRDDSADSEASGKYPSVSDNDKDTFADLLHYSDITTPAKKLKHRNITNPSPLETEDASARPQQTPSKKQSPPLPSSYFEDSHISAQRNQTLLSTSSPKRDDSDRIGNISHSNMDEDHTTSMLLGAVDDLRVPLREGFDLSLVGHEAEETANKRISTFMETALQDLQREAKATISRFRTDLAQAMLNTFEEERRRYTQETYQLRKELEEVKEIARTYRTSAQSKESVIEELKSALSNEQNRAAKIESEYNEKQQALEDAEEEFKLRKAETHYHFLLKRRCFVALAGIIKGRWKARMDRICQSKAEETVLKIQREYENQLTLVNTRLSEAYQEIEMYKRKRALYEENMKKAFMRGICALNMEAMTLCRPDTEVLREQDPHQNINTSSYQYNQEDMVFSGRENLYSENEILRPQVPNNVPASGTFDQSTTEQLQSTSARTVHVAKNKSATEQHVHFVNPKQVQKEEQRRKETLGGWKPRLPKKTNTEPTVSVERHTHVSHEPTRNNPRVQQLRQQRLGITLVP
eukprot:m.71108 g.71108  ORF g.71108 m.71108 type:complete len:523 (-) comp12211_c0_seq1:100-1668(-)